METVSKPPLELTKGLELQGRKWLESLTRLVNSVLVNSSSIQRVRLSVGGRWTFYTDKRWIGFSVNYGDATENHTQTGGTGATPTVTWNQLGPIMKTGEKAVGFNIIGRANSNEVTGINLRIYFQTGDFAAGWDTLGETTRTEIYSADGLDFANSDMKKHLLDLDYTATADGFVLVFIQPVGTLTATRYLTAGASIDMEV